MRDFQRQRIYDAEKPLHALPQNGRLPSVADMQSFVDKVLGSRYWRKNHPGTHLVFVSDGRSRRRGNCRHTWGGYRLAMPRHTRHVAYLLHEIAHTVSPDKHGRRFARNYLLLVKQFMGAEAFEVLLASFRDHGVDWEGAV